MSTLYTLKVIRAEGIQWRPKHFQSKTPKLYTEVKLANKTKLTTKPIRSEKPVWEELFAFSPSSTSEILTIEVKHKRSINFQSDTVLGSCEFNLSDLLAKCANKDGGASSHVCEQTARLDLYSIHEDSSHGPAGSIYVHLEAKNPMKVVATEVDAANENVRASDIATSAKAGDPIVTAVGTACEVGDSEFYQTICDLFSLLNGFVKFIGGLSEAHPYLKVAYELTFALYNSISKQFETDKALVDLVKIMIKAFGFAKEARTLKDKTQRCAETIDKLLQQTIECCRFVKQYTSNGFIRRMVKMGDGKKISDFKQSFDDLKNALDSNVTLHTAFVSARISERIDALEIDQRLLVLKNSLKPFDIKATDNPLCLDGTREDILSEVKGWLLSEEEGAQNMLWLHGIAGSGKSTIIATIADYCLDKSYLGAFLFFKRGMEQPETIIPTIAYKLSEFDPSIAKHIPAEGNIAEGQIERQFEMLLKGPLTAAAGVVQGPVVIILDALDEYGTPKTRSRLLKVLREQAPSLPNNFKFIVTSRPERDIVNAFTSQGTSPHIREIELKIASDKCRRDVRYYIDVEVRRIVADEGIEDKSLQITIDHLGDASGNLFIWASTVIKLVSEHDSPVRKLKEIASNTGSLVGIYQLYDTVLRNSTISWEDSISRDRCVRVLGMVLLSKIPLTTREIDGILGLSIDDSCHRTLSRLRSVIDYRPDGSGPVRLFHTSFFDYLTSSADIGDWFVDCRARHSFIAERCFNIMNAQLRFNICDVKTSYERNDCDLGLKARIEAEIPSHLSYAYRFWSQHLCEAPYGQKLVEGLSTFVYCRFLYWLEVMSLFKKIGSVGPALLMAMKWIGNNETETTAFLRDARRLISIFALPISQSVPHIYLSMLPIMANESKVSAHYLQHSSSLVRIIRRGVKRRSPLLKLLKGHTDRVTSVGFSPDGSLIVSGSWDRTIRLWDTESGEPAAPPFKVDIDWVRSATFSPDGMHIVVGGESGITILDAESGSSIAGPFGDARVLFVVISPDGRHVISASSEKSESFYGLTGDRVASALSKIVKMWDLNIGSIVGEPFVGHTDMVLCAAYSRDGRFIVTGSMDESVRVWEVESRRQVRGPFLEHKGNIYSVDFSPDGKYVVSGADDNTVRVWEVEKGEVEYSPLTGHKYEVVTVAYSSDGARIVSCSSDDTVMVWNSANGQLVSGPFISSSSEGNWSPDDGGRAMFSPDRTRVAVAASNDRSLRIFDAESGKIESGLERVRRVNNVRFSTDGSCVISDDGTTWDIENGEEVSKTEIEWQTLKVTSGMQIEVEGEIRWDPSIGYTTLSYYSVAVSPNGKRFAFGYFDGSIRIWDKERDVFVRGPFDGQGGNIYSLTFSPDGRHIASGSDNVRVWDAETGRLLLGPFPEFTEMFVTAVAYSPDGRHITSGSTDRTVRVLELETGRWEIFEGHSDMVISVSFSPDGSRIVSSCGNGSDEVRIWSIRGLAKKDQNRLLASNSLDLSTWALDSDGWVRGVHDELLLWVPIDLRPNLWRPRNVAVLNVEFSTELDFSGGVHGEHWHECFRRPQALV